MKVISAGTSRVIQHLMNAVQGKGTVAIFTAVQKEGKGSTIDSGKNAKNYAELGNLLNTLKNGAIPLAGIWQGTTEDSYLVPNISLDMAKKLNASYHQWAFIFAGPETSGSFQLWATPDNQAGADSYAVMTSWNNFAVGGLKDPQGYSKTKDGDKFSFYEGGDAPQEYMKALMELNKWSNESIDAVKVDFKDADRVERTKEKHNKLQEQIAASKEGKVMSQTTLKTVEAVKQLKAEYVAINGNDSGFNSWLQRSMDPEMFQFTQAAINQAREMAPLIPNFKEGDVIDHNGTLYVVAVPGEKTLTCTQWEDPTPGESVEITPDITTTIEGHIGVGAFGDGLEEGKIQDLAAVTAVVAKKETYGSKMYHPVIFYIFGKFGSKYETTQGLLDLDTLGEAILNLVPAYSDNALLGKAIIALADDPHKGREYPLSVEEIGRRSRLYARSYLPGWRESKDSTVVTAAKAEGAGDVSPENTAKIVEYVSNTENLDDSQFHAFVESLGVDPHEAEEIIYGEFNKATASDNLIRDSIKVSDSGLKGDAFTKYMDKSPLPTDVIPNNMGINLCNVESISWEKLPDGQLVSLSIQFLPDMLGMMKAESSTKPKRRKASTGKVDSDDPFVSSSYVPEKDMDIEAFLNINSHLVGDYQKDLKSLSEEDMKDLFEPFKASNILYFDDYIKSVGYSRWDEESRGRFYNKSSFHTTSRFGAKGYWISPTGTMSVCSTSHIAEVIKKPEAFGLTREEIEALYKETGEPLGHEGIAREEIMTELLNKGWVRIRWVPANYSWTVQVGKMSKTVMDNLQSWAFELLSTDDDNKNTDVTIVPIDAGVSPSHLSLPDVAADKLFAMASDNSDDSRVYMQKLNNRAAVLAAFGNPPAGVELSWNKMEGEPEKLTVYFDGRSPEARDYADKLKQEGKDMVQLTNKPGKSFTKAAIGDPHPRDIRKSAGEFINTVKALNGSMEEFKSMFDTFLLSIDSYDLPDIDAGDTQRIEKIVDKIRAADENFTSTGDVVDMVEELYEALDGVAGFEVDASMKTVAVASVEKIATEEGYDFYMGTNDGKYFYNVVPEGTPAPDKGYYSVQDILKQQDIPEVFKDFAKNEMTLSE